MTRMHDEVVGDLDYDYGWWRLARIDCFGRAWDVRLAFAGDADAPLEQTQQDAFASFWRDRDRLLQEAAEAILVHYRSIRIDVIARHPSADAETAAPDVVTLAEMRELVQPEAVFFPENFDTEMRVVGLLAQCRWEPSLGLAVRFENERVTQVGPQDIVL